MAGSYTPGPTSYLHEIQYTPARETLTSETQNCFTPGYESVLDPRAIAGIGNPLEFSPRKDDSIQLDSEPAGSGNNDVDTEKGSSTAYTNEQTVESSTIPEDLAASEYNPNEPNAPDDYPSLPTENMPTPESVATSEGLTSEPAISEGFASPCTLQSETVFSNIRSESPFTPLQSETVFSNATTHSVTSLQNETVYSNATTHSVTSLQNETVYSNATLHSETLTSPSGSTSQCTIVNTTTSPELMKSPVIQESLVSETVSMATPSFDNFCYSPLRTEDMNQLDLCPKPKIDGSPDKVTRVTSELDRVELKVDITSTQSENTAASPNKSTYSPGPVDSKVHYSPGPIEYIPEHISNEIQEVCYTPARPILSGIQLVGEMTPHETEMICEAMTPSEHTISNAVQQLTPRETEIDCGGTGEVMTPKEMTPNETEINCGRYESEGESEVDSDVDSEGQPRDTKKRQLSETSDEATVAPDRVNCKHVHNLYFFIIIHRPRVNWLAIYSLFNTLTKHSM